MTHLLLFWFNIKHWWFTRVFVHQEYQHRYRIFGKIDWYYKGRSEWTYGIAIHSGDKDDYPGNKLVINLHHWAFWINIPRILKPHKMTKTFTHLSKEAAERRMAQHGHLNYDEYFDRQYGFTFSRTTLHYSYGPSTMDSMTSKSGVWFYPWMEYDLVKDVKIDAAGNEYSFKGMKYEDYSKIKETMPLSVYLLHDYDGKPIRAYCHLEVREYRIGRGWVKKLLGNLRPRRVFKSMDIQFDGETGPEKGSWKGGTTGTGVKLDDKLDQFNCDYGIAKYCDGEHRSKYQKFKMSLMQKLEDSHFDHDMYRLACCIREGKPFLTKEELAAKNQAAQNEGVTANAVPRAE